MSEPTSPLKRSIGLSGVVRFLIAVLAVVAIGAAVAAGSYTVAIAAGAFVVGAIALGYRAWRARRDTRAHTTPDPRG